jgi:hypothetical protein
MVPTAHPSPTAGSAPAGTASWAPMDGGRGRVHLGVVAIVVVALAVIGGAIVLALDAAPSAESAAGASVSEAATGTQHHVAGFATEEPVTDEATRRTLRQQLGAARASVEGIHTTDDAKAHGFVPVTLDLAYLGVHYLSTENLEQPFSPGRPTHLIFDRDGPEGRLIGLMYYIDTPGGAPDGFAGPNDHWHNHVAACMSNGFMLALDDVTVRSCTRLGGTLEALPPSYASRWMLHVWVVPGNANPWGRFADGNPALA